MKRFFLYTAAALLVLCAAISMASCSDDLTGSASTPIEGEQVVTLALDVPDALALTRADATRATNSANGGLTNVDMEQYDLRYQVAVYRIDTEADDSTSYAKVIDNQPQVFDTYQSSVYQLRLTPGREYRVVAWADFVEQGETVDLHYQTNDLRAITLSAEGAHLNDESRDAFFASADLSLGTATSDNGFSLALTLRRPFAKVRVITTDWDTYNGTLAMPDNFRITYQGGTRFFTGIDLVTGEANSEATATTILHTGDLIEYSAGRDAAEADAQTGARQRTLTVDYLMQDVYAEDSQEAIHFLLEAMQGETEVARFDFATDIPVRRNWLTTIVGNFLTVDATFDVDINEEFEDEYIKDNIGLYFFGDSKLYTDADGNPLPGYTHVPAKQPELVDGAYRIRTAEQLAWIEENEEQVKTEGYNILLMNDIDLRHIFWSPIDLYEPDDTQGSVFINSRQTFDGQGFTIKNLTIEGQNANAGLFGNSEIHIKNVTLENVYFYNTNYGDGALSGSHKNGQIENCHAKHVFIRNEGYTDPNKAAGELEYHPTGGLVGRVSATSISNCSVYDIDIQNSTGTGGIAGQATDVSFIGCEVDHARIWYVRHLEDDTEITLIADQKHTHDGVECDKSPERTFGFWYYGTWYECSNYIGSIVGCYHSAESSSAKAVTTAFSDCKASNVELMYFDHHDFSNVMTYTLPNDEADFAADLEARSYEWCDLNDKGEGIKVRTFVYGPTGYFYGMTVE